MNVLRNSRSDAAPHLSEPLPRRLGLQPFRRRARRGVSFIEIALGTIIFALALLPVFGLIQSGLIRSDVSVSYSAATEMASAVMNKLLSEVLPFEKIPVSPSGGYKQPTGSVAAETDLDPIFDESGWSTDGNARTLTRNNIKYFVEIWVGEFLQDTNLEFRYLENPNIDFNQASPYDKYYAAIRLKEADWDFSPYNAETTHRYPGAQGGEPWSSASSVVTKNQWEVISAVDPDLPRNQNHTLKKLVVRVSWSGSPTGRKALGAATKEFWLISFRANLGGV